jgi:isopropylmalate/homocitrate/citramalate synthase
MDTTAITDIAEYFKKEMGYTIPPMTPFVGEDFNMTRAGIHADGLMKDEEIYNIFNTAKLLNRPATVSVTNTSGLAGIAYWINCHYHLSGEGAVSKRDPMVLWIKEKTDAEYAKGRQTAMSTKELEALVEAWTKQQNAQ